MTKPSIVVVWHKRDLRVKDHEPLNRAIETGLPILPLYLFEPELIEDPHYSQRHWRFVWESLLELKTVLSAHNAPLCVSFESPERFFCRLYEPTPLALRMGKLTRIKNSFISTQCAIMCVI